MYNKPCILLILFHLLALLSLHCQSSAFVIVDVSGSGPEKKVKEEAKSITQDLIMGTFNAASYPHWKWYETDTPITNIVSGKQVPLIDTNKDGYLMIMPCGNKNRYKDYKIEKLQQVPGDLISFFQSVYPRNFNDQTTFIKIARAKAASLAKSPAVGISSFYLIEITDDLNDTGSLNPNYSQQEKDILSTYGSSKASTLKVGTLRYEGLDHKNYQIVVSKVNIQTSNVIPTTPDTNSVIKKELSLIRPNTTNKRKPMNTEDNAVQVMWKCLGCPENTEYTIRAKYLGKKKGVRPVTQKTSQTSIRLSLEEEGLYQIMVSGAGVRAKSAFIQANPSGGGGGFMFFLILLLIGAAVYYFFFRNQNSSLMEQEQERPPKPPQRKDRPNGNDYDSSGGDDLF